MKRRQALRTLGAGAAAILAAPLINRGRYTLFPQVAREYSARTVRLVRESLVIDMLNQFREPVETRGERTVLRSWLSEPAMFGRSDFELYRDSGIDVFALGTGPYGYEDAYQWFAEWSGFIAHHGQWFTRIDEVADFARLRETGQLGILLSCQLSEHFRTPEDVRTFHGLGQRVSQLTYNERNRIGSGAFDRRDAGLSRFGVRIVEAMNEVGMAVDVSHCSDRTILDAIDASTRPVLITHANARALVADADPGRWYPYHRAVTDEAIRGMAAKGGVMGIAFIRFMVRDRDPTTIEHVLDHFDHVARLVGVEHVGIGSDYELEPTPAHLMADRLADVDPRFGVRGPPTIEGLDHPKRVYDLTEGLIRRGYGDDDVALILGGNFRRVLGTIWGDA
jgi:membrane dipeptidase